MKISPGLFFKGGTVFEQWLCAMLGVYFGGISEASAPRTPQSSFATS